MVSGSSFVRRSSRHRAATLALALGLLALPAARGLAVGPHPRLVRERRERLARLGPAIEEVVFVGNESFDGKTLSRYMETRPGWLLATRRYSSRTLRKDLLNLERFYTTQGFLDAEVWVGEIRASADSASVAIAVEVREGPRYLVTRVSFEGNRVLSEEDLRKIVFVEDGSPLLTNVLESDRRNVLNAYAARSFLDATVAQDVSVDDRRGEAEIRYTIVEREPAAIGSIEVGGNEKTREYVLRREIEFAEGQPFDFIKVGATQAGLYRTGLFHSVWIEPDPADTGRPVKRVVVRVNERPSGAFDLGAGYAAIDGFEIDASLTNRNVQGQAIRLGLEGSVSEFARGARLTVGDPWFLGVPVAADATGGYERREEESFVAETAGGSFVLTKTIGRALTVSGGYEFNRTLVLEAAEGVEGEDGANYTSDLVLAATYDTRDNVLNARRGIVARAQVDFASSRLGGTNDFVRTELLVRAYRSLHRRSVGAVSVLVGWIKPQGGESEVPAQERYFAGGEGSVRGFDRNSLGPRGPDGSVAGGRALAEVRAEARFRVFGSFGVVIFADAGQAFTDIRSSRIDDLAVAAGGGLRYETRLGVLRLDAATPLSEDGPVRFYVSVGQAF